MSLNYPLNPDTSFESFFLTDPKDVFAAFGQNYSQTQLVPMNYQKIMQGCVSGALTYAPVRELCFISDPFKYQDISSEDSNELQSINLKDLLIQAYSYWKTNLLNVPVFQCVGGVVVEITQQILPDSTAIPTGVFYIETKFKINWLVIAGSFYA